MIWIALALALLPLVVSATELVTEVGHDYQPTADIASMELLTRDVGRHPVLTGLYSRDGWKHPGPALFYVLALPYRLSGSNSIGLPLGALIINGLAIAGMAWVAMRRGGTPVALLTLVGCGLLVRALGPAFMRDPWNPSIPVLPFGLLVFLVWEMASGNAWALPVAAGVASFCVQTHVGYVPLAIPLWLFGFAAMVRLARRSGLQQPRRRDVARAGLTSAAVVAVMWLPPLVEQFTHSPGNLTRVAKYFATSGGRVHSLGDGFRVVGAQFGFPPEWVTGAKRPNPFTGETDFIHSAPVPVLLILFGWAVLALWRQHGTEASRLAATVGLALGLGVVSIAGTVGVVYAYRLRWTWVLAMLAMLVVAWAAWTRVRGLASWWVVTSVIALVVLAGVNSVSAARAGTPQAQESSRLSALMSSVTNGLPRGPGAVIVRSASFEGSFYAAGLVLQLERRGIAVSTDSKADDVAIRGTHRGRGVRAILTTATNGDVDALLARHDGRLVAYQGTLPAPERARVLEQLAALRIAHRSGTLGDVAYFVDGSRLTRRLGYAVGVFMTER